MKAPHSISHASSSSFTSLFVYGTLMAPQVMEALLGRLPSNRHAVLSGHIRHPVRGQAFPGMIPASNPASSATKTTAAATTTTQGILYIGLTPSEMKRLDWFEDVDYTRRQVVVSILESSTADAASSSSSQVQEVADTYIWTNPLSELDLTQEWSFQKFCRENLASYLLRTVEPCRMELERMGYE